MPSGVLAISRSRSTYAGRRPARWYLLDQIDSLLEIHAEVNERPFNALALVFLLLEDEHVVVEELLQLLVGEVDAQLLKAVELLDRPTDREIDRESRVRRPCGIRSTKGVKRRTEKETRQEQPSLVLPGARSLVLDR